MMIEQAFKPGVNIAPRISSVLFSAQPSRFGSGSFEMGLEVGRAERQSKKGLAFLQAPFLFGAPEEIRTPDPLVRSQVLYPAELRAREAAL